MHRNDYEKHIRDKLKELEQEVERLREQLKAREGEVPREHEQHFKQIHDINERAKQTLAELGEADDDKFHALKPKLEDYWSSLGREIKAYDKKLNS